MQIPKGGLGSHAADLKALHDINRENQMLTEKNESLSGELAAANARIEELEELIDGEEDDEDDESKDSEDDWNSDDEDESEDEDTMRGSR